MGTRYTTGEDAAGIFAHPAPDDLSIAVTEFELRTLLGLLPPDDALPIASRGDVFVLMPGSHTLRYVVALARMRDAQVGPEDREDASDAQEPAQPQDQPVPAPGRDARLERLADDFQDVLERFMTRVEVDPDKYDHQNRAGDVVALLLAALRRHDYLPEPVDGPNAWRITRGYYLSHHQDVRAAVARGISTASLSTLRETARIGQLIMDELDAVFESRDVAR